MMWNKWEAFAKRNTPPGLDLIPELKTFLIGVLSAGGIGTMLFFSVYLKARNALYQKPDLKGVRKLIPGAVMEPFLPMAETMMLCFWMLGCCMLLFSIYHYLSFRTGGSKSIYLMKRLPDRRELHRRVWMLPLLAVVLCAVCAAVFTLVYFLIYRFCTPGVCLSELGIF